MNSIQYSTDTITNNIATLSQTTQTHGSVIGDVQITLDNHTNAINTHTGSINASIDTINRHTGLINSNTAMINTTKSYFFGGRTYAVYQDKYLLTKGINLPDIFSMYDVNNFFVSVTMETDILVENVAPRITKDIGCFMVYFRSLNGNWNENSVIWFNYTVIINH